MAHVTRCTIGKNVQVKRKTMNLNLKLVAYIGWVYVSTMQIVHQDPIASYLTTSGSRYNKSQAAGSITACLDRTSNITCQESIADPAGALLTSGACVANHVPIGDVLPHNVISSNWPDMAALHCASRGSGGCADSLAVLKQRQPYNH